MLRTEGENVWEAEDWIQLLQEAAEHYNLNY